MSQYCRPSGVLVPSPSTLVGPPAVGAFAVPVCAFALCDQATVSTSSTSIPCFIISSPQSQKPIVTEDAAALNGPLLRQCDHIDFDEHILGKPRHFHGRARRRCGVEVSSVNLVHGGKVTHVLQKHCAANNFFEAGPGRAQN